MFDMIPLYNFGLPDLVKLTTDIKRINKPVRINEKGRRFYESEFVTPKGTLNSLVLEDELKGSCQTKYLITEEDELSRLEYFLDSLLGVKDYSFITNGIEEYRKIIGNNNALDIQWAMQPYELFCFPNTCGKCTCNV